MMEGPENVAIEEWFGYFYNSLLEYKAYMEKELGRQLREILGKKMLPEFWNTVSMQNIQSIM